MDARDVVEVAVRRELVGPSGLEAPSSKQLDTSPGLLAFESWEKARGPWHDAATGQEILSEIEPLRRYGIGVLHAKGNVAEDLSGITGLPADDDIGDAPPGAQLQPPEPPEADSDDFDLTDANSFQPKAMAVSFKARLSGGSLRVEARAAAYEKLTVRVAGAKRDRDWWVRRPITLSATAGSDSLLSMTNRLAPLHAEVEGQAKVLPQLQVYSRPVPGDPDPTCRIVTVALINTTTGQGSAAALFQASFEVRPGGAMQIEAYPEPLPPGGADEEEQSIALLYRNKQTYAVGHGCAAGWNEPSGGTTDVVRAEPLPSYEVGSLTPDVGGGQGEQPLRVSMSALAAPDQTEGRRQVERMLGLYRQWMTDREAESASLDPRFHAAAVRHVRRCREALARMTRGWELATTDPLASRAFRLANEAMLHQQARSRLPLRECTFRKDGTVEIAGPQPSPEHTAGTGYWRPFQIAFLLASLPELVYPESHNRDLVDLIFFPTGGGKTEAYLGAAAVSMLARRLRNPDDAGTDVLMRYTLRLLTAQQFLRAAALLCVLDDIRSNTPELGTERFTIGIWLGGATTPNTWRAAKESFGRLRNDARAPNPFLLLRCPWCGARMGAIPIPGRTGKRQPMGYIQVGSRIRFTCPDAACRFGGKDSLPVHVVDDDIYDRRPTLVIGTVDKFAMLAWRPEARRLFGLNHMGDREASPPSLIIQDELHLIAGPLGSMVGIYEPVIEDLCTDRRSDPHIRPKIIAATATIRRYDKQVRDLYGRSRVALFPPHGLEEGRSFFAEPATMPDGTPAPGRRYLGVMSPSLGSIQTVQVRVAAATLQAGHGIPKSTRDGYWTNLNFLNSLRELGNTVSLLQSDIPDYLTGMWKREGLDPGDVRWPRNVLELTSRRRSDEIPKAIEELQLEYGSDRCVDVCLASNIIEVGVDIDRLALMTIVGQPKTTAQYIQVSGRVGRRWWERPGLVITIYGAAKPRDRSHYERFRSYHQRLYAQVEPASLTPFAVPVMQRGLHGAVISRIRQSAPEALPVFPFPADFFDEAVRLLESRAEVADAAEVLSLKRVANQRAREWREWERTEWDGNPGSGDPIQGLMRYAGTPIELGSKVTVWEVPTSMRSVDAECTLKVTDAYIHDAANSAPEAQ
jgi:hypothetical protein